MAKKRSRHLVEYLLLRLLEGGAGLLPRFLALRCGAFIGRLLCAAGVLRRIALANLRHTGVGGSNPEQFLPHLYTWMGRYAVDFLRPATEPRRVLVQNEHLFETAFARNRGVIVLLAHFGNWELLAALYGKKIPDLNVLAKPMRNPFVETWLRKKRRATGITTIYARQALRRSLRVLRRNGMLALLVDQHASRQGTVVPFLGKPAKTFRTVAGLIKQTGATVLPMYALLNRDGSYTISISEAPPPPLPPQGATEEWIHAVQTQHNEIISEWIRGHPAHWFGWFHKRFRGRVKYGAPAQSRRMKK